MNKYVIALFLLTTLVRPLLHAHNQQLAEWIDQQAYKELNTFCETNKQKDVTIVQGETVISPLVYALWNEKHLASALMADKGISIDQQSIIGENQYYPLSIAIDHKNLPNIFLLLYRGADLSKTIQSFNRGETLLFQYLQNSRILEREELEKLLPNTIHKKRQEIKAILKKDKVRLLKKKFKQDPFLNDFKLLVDTSLQKEEERYQSLLEAAVYFGAVKCVNFLVKKNGGSYVRNVASDAIKYDHINILKSLINDFSQSDLPSLLQTAYSYTNYSAVKIILNHFRELESAFLFNGASVFDYAWVSGNVDIVMFTIMAYKNKKQIQQQFMNVYQDRLSELKKEVTKENIQEYSVSDSCTLLHLAVYLGKTEIIKYLLEIGADPGWQSQYLGSQPIYLAVIMGQRDAFVLLEEAHAVMEHFHATHIDKEQPFSLVDYVYQRFGDEFARTVVEKGVDNTIELMGYGLYSHSLIMAIKKNDFKHVEYLLTEYEALYAKCVVAMEYVIKYNRQDILRLFFDKGYDLNKYDQLIEYAIQYDNSEAYKFLLKSNPGYNTAPDAYFASKYDNVKLMQRLLKTGLEPHTLVNKDIFSGIDQDGTLLSVAVAHGSYRVVELILNQHVSMDQIDDRGRSLLYLAVMNNDLKMAGLLLDYKADPNQYLSLQNKDMIYSSAHFNNKGINNEDKRTVLDFTPFYGMFSLLRDHGARYSWESDRNIEH